MLFISGIAYWWVYVYYKGINRIKHDAVNLLIASIGVNAVEKIVCKLMKHFLNLRSMRNSSTSFSPSCMCCWISPKVISDLVSASCINVSNFILAWNKEIMLNCSNRLVLRSWAPWNLARYNWISLIFVWDLVISRCVVGTLRLELFLSETGLWACISITKIMFLI